MRRKPLLEEKPAGSPVSGDFGGEHRTTNGHGFEQMKGLGQPGDRRLGDAPRDGIGCRMHRRDAESAAAGLPRKRGGRVRNLSFGWDAGWKGKLVHGSHLRVAREPARGVLDSRGGNASGDQGDWMRDAS